MFFSYFLKLLVRQNNYKNLSYRMISGSEIATALRPFYFVVHPDLFGRFPEQRTTNEDSLKQLSVFLESLHTEKQSVSPTSLPFWVRNFDLEKKGETKLINVPLQRHIDGKVVLKKILESCSLSTEYIDKVKSLSKVNTTKSSNENKPFPNSTNEDENFDVSNIFEKNKYARNELRLKSWLETNMTISLIRKLALHDLKDEVQKLEGILEKRLKIKKIRYDCGWNVEHYRGCLKRLENLANLYIDDLKSIEDRILVFAPFTGVSLDGHIMLFTGDVQRSWLDLLRNIPKHDSHLKKIPEYEFALRQVLRNIKVKRRKFMPKTHASEYTSHLRKVITSLLDYLAKQQFPESWPSSLEKFEIVVESEAGPLMISPTGQIIIPATCPGFLLVDFITNHLEEAAKNAIEYKRTKYIEKELYKQASLKLQISTLKKDDSITPDRMINCLGRLISSNLKFPEIDLHITHYYSVLSDGTVCIPWDWTI